LTHPSVATEPGQPIAERGAGREITACQLEVEVVEDRLPRVEVASPLLQETNRALGDRDLGGELALGKMPGLSVLSEVGAEVRIGKKFTQNRGPQGPKPARSLIDLSSNWEGSANLSTGLLGTTAGAWQPSSTTAAGSVAGTGAVNPRPQNLIPSERCEELATTVEYPVTDYPFARRFPCWSKASFVP
jgi:hypothetical protein